MSNQDSTSLKYEKRRYYRHAFFNDFENKIDFWRQSRYYGILDLNTTPVYLNKTYLKSITTPSISNTIQKQTVLNIVADSFKEMIQEFKVADQSLLIPKSIYNPINVKKSTLIFEDEYSSFLKSILDTWFNVNKNKINFNIINFDEFIKLFIFSNTTLYSPILSQTSYLTSFISSPLLTGLVLEISNEKHDRDDKKIQSFIKDQNFDFFVNTAAKYSFLVDKNAPWRLVYNLNTEYALDKMNNYEVENLDDLFTKYYIYPHLIEYKIIRDNLVSFYETKISKKPTTQVTTLCPVTKKLKFETVLKETDTTKQDLFWIQMYYYIRCREEKIGMSQSQFDNDLKTLSTIYNTFGEESTLNWILNKTKKFVDGGTNPSYNQIRTVQKNKSNNSVMYSFNF